MSYRPTPNPGTVVPLPSHAPQVIPALPSAFPSPASPSGHPVKPPLVPGTPFPVSR